jgi:sugar/nucleoside kinase (ribokinase family)
LKRYAENFVITLGGQGALIYNGHDFLHVSAHKTIVVDTVGAGDVFAGAYIYGITHGYSLSEAGELASFAASKVVSKFGPRLNEEEIAEVAQLLDTQAVYA